MNRLIALALLLSGCQFVPGSDAAKIREAEKVVAEKLSDPGSAQFRNGRVAQPGLVCGEVNSRNRFGGYVGFSPYAYASGNRNAYLSTAPSVDDTRDNVVCAGDGKRSLCCNGSSFPVPAA